MSKMTPEKFSGFVIFDVDLTLFPFESWQKLVEFLNADLDEHMRIYTEYWNKVTNPMNGKENDLDRKMPQEIIASWEKSRGGKKIHRSEIDAAFNKFRELMAEEGMTDELKQLMNDVIELGLVPIVGTAGTEKAAQIIAEESGITELLTDDPKQLHLWFGNTKFFYDKDGYLVNFSYEKDVSGQKAKKAGKMVLTIANHLAPEKEELTVISVGDGPTELGLFAISLGIAFLPKPQNPEIANEARLTIREADVEAHGRYQAMSMAVKEVMRGTTEASNENKEEILD